MSTTSWHVNNCLARLQLARLSASVNLLEPSAGLHQLCANAQSVADCHVLRVELPALAAGTLAPSDFFLRGGDLAVVYADRPERAMRTQIYWRAAPGHSAGVIATIELLVSVETGLLDSCPRLSTSSRLPASRVFQVDGAGNATPLDTKNSSETATAIGHLFRLGDDDLFSYAEMVHPDDARSTQVRRSAGDSGRTTQLRHELFSERLEKGVILRARVRGVVLERADDVQHAAAMFNEFLHAELPLTT